MIEQTRFGALPHPPPNLPLERGGENQPPWAAHGFIGPFEGLTKINKAHIAEIRSTNQGGGRSNRSARTLRFSTAHPLYAVVCLLILVMAKFLPKTV